MVQGPVTMAADTVAGKDGMAARAPAPVISQADHPVAAAGVEAHVPAGAGTPVVVVVAAVDINQVRAQAAQAVATCARMAISATAAMVGPAVGIADC